MTATISEIRIVRLFVSSPSDVKQERERIDRVVERLNNSFAGLLRIETVRWEKKFYTADASFQDQIPPASDCDLVIAVFWSRLGTPLPENFSRMESGERYPSGAAFEVLSALEARKKGERPDVYVFRKTTPPPPGTDEAQYKDLTAFFTRWFQTPDGQFLRARHRFETTDEFESQFERLLRAWIAERVPRDKSLIWPLETKGSPFRALLPFDAKHAAIYFGRDRKVTRAIEQIQNVARVGRGARSGPRNIPFLLIIGESGSGKSSLMRAGLAPRLTAPGMTPQVDVWRTAVMRVGDDVNPFLTLAKALLVENDDEHGFGAALPELSEQGVRSTDALSELLARKSDQSEKRARPSAVRPIVKTLFSIQANERQRGGFQRRLRANLLILVDQFENIFVSTVSDEHRSIFARLLFSLCATRRVWVAATLRSDFYARLIAPGDFLALKDAGGTYDLAAPGESELQQIVHRSAAAAGLVYEMNPETGERLDERILKDAQGKNTLPLLQFALDRLFSRRKVVRVPRADDPETVEEEVRLTFDAYEAIGGLDGAINQTAESALANLGSTELAALPRLLRCLAAPMSDQQGDAARGGEFTVRAAPSTEAAPDAAAERLVDALTKARIVVVTATEEQNGAAGARLISLAHQRVFESWTRARKIVGEHREFFRIRDEIDAQLRRWQAAGRPAALLLQRGVPLAEGQKILKSYSKELSENFRSYIAISSRRAQRVNIALSIATAVFAGLAVVATYSYVNAATNYGAAKGAVSGLVEIITKQLRDAEGIRLETVRKVLELVDNTISKVQAVGAKDPEVARIRATTLFEKGKMLRRSEDIEGAAKAAKESLDIRSKLTRFDQWKSKPDLFEAAPSQQRFELAQSVGFDGDLARDRKEYTTARERFGDAQKLLQELVARADNKDEWAHELAKTYTRLGDLDAQQTRPDLISARRNYEHSLKIAADSYYRDESNILWQRELSWDFNKLGDVNVKIGDSRGDSTNARIKHDEYVSALEAYMSGLCLRKHVFSQDPTRTEFEADVSFSLERVGDVRRRLDDLSGAGVAYAEAARIRQRLMNSVPDNTQYVSNYADTLQKIAEFNWYLEDMKIGLAFQDAVVDSRKMVVKRSPSDAKAQESLEKAQRKAEDFRRRMAEKNYRASGFIEEWWRAPVADRLALFERHRHDAKENPGKCMGDVLKVLDKVTSEASSASTR